MKGVLTFLPQGYVELLIHPLKPDLKKIKVNSKQCHILCLSFVGCFVDTREGCELW